MVTIAPSARLADLVPTLFVLRDQATDRTLMERMLRPVDAARFNAEWSNRGLNTRWLPKG